MANFKKISDSIKSQILSNHRFYWRVQFNLGGMVDGDGKFVRVKRSQHPEWVLIKRITMAESETPK